MLYLDSAIPSYLFQDGFLICRNPAQGTRTQPPEKYIRTLFEESGHIRYCSTEYGLYYGCIQLTCRSNLYLVLGPISNIPYGENEFHHMYLDYVVPFDEQESFRNFFLNSPQLPLSAFLLKLIFVNYCVNKEIISLQALLPVPASSTENTEEELTEKTFQQKEDFYHNKSYEMESLILTLVQTGNAERIRNLTVSDSSIHIGITGPTALRQLKNNLIISTTLITRAAIDGGLDYDTAYQMSDHFISEAEKTSSSDVLYALLGQIPYTFAEKVHEVQTPSSSDETVQAAIRFIQQHTNQPLTVSDVAEHVGFSRAYFSTYFKQQLGFGIAAFINRCKLEEARRLLQYTNKSVSVISSYLCYSSQSHFQKAFKKQFGMTPVQYRKTPGKTIR